MTIRKFKKSYKALRKKGASYYEAKILVKAFINGNVDKFKTFGGTVSEVYYPLEDRWKTNYSFRGYSLRRGRKKYLIEKYQ